MTFVLSWGERMNEQEAQETADIAREAAPRRAQITRKDFERFGFTAGCPGCRTVLSGKSRQGHSESSRIRMERELTGDPKAVSAWHREHLYLEKALEKENRKRRRTGINQPKSQSRVNWYGRRGG